MNWNWILAAAFAPLAAGLLVALPFWRKNLATLGSLAGTVLAFVCAALLISREYAELERLTEICLADTGFACVFDPSPFARFAVYACVALVQGFILFIAGLKVEERIRNSAYAPEWR
ncbi:MAG: hypothetical protein M3R55_02950 [Acidobacteriota bacterium]|nr:hypothetical protein [Acidobacteriota bacterium]